MQAFIELPGVLLPTLPTEVPPADNVLPAQWSSEGDPLPVFIKYLNFPGKLLTANNAEWDGWRQRNVEFLKRRILESENLDRLYVLKPYGYRLDDDPCVVVPRTSGGNILQYVSHRPELEEPDKISLLLSAARCVLHLHTRRPPIIHGGIHPTEFLVNNNGEAVLIDLGLSYIVTTLGPPPSQAHSLRSTPIGGYYAPEIVKREALTTSVDVYGFAGVLLAVLSGHHPHQDSPVPELAWMKGKPSFENHSQLPKHHPLWDFMSKMWNKRPSDRPAMMEVVEYLEESLKSQHPEASFAIEPVPSSDPWTIRPLQPSQAPAPEMPNIAPLKQEGPGSDLPPELEGNLEMIRHDVGRGGTSTVSQSKWHKPLSNGNILTILVAVKVMRISDQQRHRMKQRFTQECKLWMKLQHEHILPLFGFRFEPETCLISPWCQNGDLHSVLAEHPDMDFTKRMDFALQVGKGLQYLHALTPPICHGDLKPRNVLINTEFKALIGDFGLSRIISEVETPPVLAPGLDGYAAPEIWLGDVPSLMTDVYAYGALALKCHSRVDPFQNVPRGLLATEIVFRSLPTAKSHRVPESHSLYQFMCWCCQNPPASRPSIDNAVRQLEKDIHTMVLQQPPLEEFTDSLTTIQPVPPNRGVDSLVPPSIAYLLSTTGDTTSQNMEISEQEPGQGVKLTQVVDTADPLSTFDFAVGPTSNTSNLPAFNMDDSATLSAGQSDPGTSGEGQVLLLPPPLPGTLTITVKKDGGQFADVYVGEWENTDGKKTVVAIKDIRCTDGAAEKRFQMRISREADIWKAVKHTNILQFIGYVVVEGISGLKLVSPWCQHGNLTSYITNNPELTRAQKIELLCGAARGLEHLHSRTPLIVHGDIKPANVVIQDNREAALCDFGLSRIILDLGKPSGLTTTGNRFGGTAGYQAKELLEGNTATPAVDVYAFGGLILAAMSGRNPLWNRKNDAARIVATCMDQLPVPKEHPGLPADDPLWGLLRECWRGEATERPTIDIVLQMLEGEKDPGDAEAKTPVPSVPSLPQPDTPGGNQS